MRNFLLAEIIQFQFWPHRRYCHVILGLRLLRKYDVISIFQDGGRGRSILLPVSYLLMSLPSEGQHLSTKNLVAINGQHYINLWLRYNDFWFGKTNVHHIGTVSLMTLHRLHRCQFSERNWILAYFSNRIRTLFCSLLWFSVAIVVLEVICYLGHVKKCNVMYVQNESCRSGQPSCMPAGVTWKWSLLLCPRPVGGGGIKQWSASVRLSDVAYIGSNSKTK